MSRGTADGVAPVRTAAALVIGNELLSGKIADTNTPFLARELRTLGVDLRRVWMVPDVSADIVDGVRTLAGAYDLLFTSGGVGPTHDDITVAAVAAACRRPLVRHPDLERSIRNHFDVAATPAALRMADLPEGAELHYGDGLWIPVVVVDNIYVLPGLPSIFRKKVIALRATLGGAPYHLVELLLEVDEVVIADALTAVADAHPEVAIGSYPQDGPERRVKLTFESRERQRVEAAVAAFRLAAGGRWDVEVAGG